MDSSEAERSGRKRKLSRRSEHRRDKRKLNAHQDDAEERASASIHISCGSCRKQVRMRYLPEPNTMVICKRCGFRFRLPETRHPVERANFPPVAPAAMPVYDPYRVMNARVLPSPRDVNSRSHDIVASWRRERISPFGLLLASTVISLSITAIALVGIAIGAFAFSRSLVSSDAISPKRIVGAVPVANPAVPAVKPVNHHEPKESDNNLISENEPAVDSTAETPAVERKGLPQEDAVALLGIFSPEKQEYVTTTIAWAIDDHHWVTTGLPYWSRDFQFVAMMADRQFVLVTPTFHPKLVEAMSLPKPDVDTAMKFDVAVFTISARIPGKLSMPQLVQEAPPTGARVLSLASLAPAVPVDFLPGFVSIPARPSPDHPEFIQLTESSNAAIGGAPILDANDRVVGMVQINVDNGEASTVSSHVIQEALEASRASAHARLVPNFDVDTLLSGQERSSSSR